MYANFHQNRLNYEVKDNSDVSFADHSSLKMGPIVLEIFMNTAEIKILS